MGGKPPGYRMFLSEKDEYVPDDFVSITEIFTNPKCRLPGYTAEEWCIGHKKLKEMRDKTFYAVRKRFYESGAAQYDRYWNSNLDAINHLGLNEFAKLGCFIELAEVMICFQVSIETKYMKGSKRKYICWGIRKRLYKQYYNNLKDALENGTETPKIKLYDAKKSNRGKLESVNLPRTKAIFGWPDGTTRKIAFEENDIYYTFLQWCKFKGVERKRALYNAMIVLMRDYPVKELENLKIEKRKTDIEMVHEISIQNNKVGCKTFSMPMPEELSKQLDNIVERYNNDPNNLGKQKLYKKALVAQAIQFYVKHLPLKYTNPLMLEEYKKIKDTEAYNKKIIEKG